MFAPGQPPLPCGDIACEPCAEGTPQRCAHRLGLLRREDCERAVGSGNGAAGTETASLQASASSTKREVGDDA
jgi:hypothetical protein